MGEEQNTEVHPLMHLNLRGRTLATALLTLGLLAAVPAAADAACMPQPATGTPFAQYGDTHLYTPASFANGAARDQPLALVNGASVTTAPMCIDATYPTFRLFAQNTGVHTGTLRVDMLYTDANGTPRTAGTGVYSSGVAGWQPTGSFAIKLNFSKVPGGALPVSFRFTANGSSTWQIDDVFVDPMARG
jgi:hypothetical protein